MIEKVRFVLLYLVLVTESIVQTHAAEPSGLAWARVNDADHPTSIRSRRRRRLRYRGPPDLLTRPCDFFGLPPYNGPVVVQGTDCE